MEIPNKLIAIVIAAIVLILGVILSVGTVNVEGSERVVWQTMDGVEETIGEDGLHFYNRWITTPHVYYIGTDTFIANDQTVNPDNTYMGESELEFNQPDMPPIVVPVQMERLTPEDLEEGKTTGPTPIVFRITMQYHVDPGRLVELHRNKTAAFRTTFVKDVVRDTLIRLSTVLDARTVYLGEGRVRLQQAVERALKEDERFNEYGVVVERFVISEVQLQDREFLAAITAEARAEQTRRTAEKREQAALAEAQAAEAEARSEQNRRLVEAETQKNEAIAAAEAQNQRAILEAQAQAEQVRLAAAAEAERMRLQGQGERDRSVAQAEGVLALGQAEAEAQRLRLEAYQGEGGARFAAVEIARSFGEGIEKVYYIPENMSINAVAGDFREAVTLALPTEARASVGGTD